MSKVIGRTQNMTSTATITSVVLNATTSTVVAAANPSRIYFYVTNDSAEEMWLKLQPAATDNDKKGIFIGKKAEPPKHWEMHPDNVYTGEISAIAGAGTPTIYITEY